MVQKILFKYPSRNRPTYFFEALDTIVNNMSDPDNYHVSCTLDLDDNTMNNPEVIERIKSYGGNVSVEWGTSDSKVHAINRNLPDYGDIIVVTSDDFHIKFYGFDALIRQCYNEYGEDILLHIPDQDAGAVLATMFIADRAYYNRFGFIYHPDYFSLHCDNEVQEVAQKLGRYRLYNSPGLIVHLNGAYGHRPKDELFIKQQEIGWSKDLETYNIRKARNFDLQLWSK